MNFQRIQTSTAKKPNSFFDFSGEGVRTPFPPSGSAPVWGKYGMFCYLQKKDARIIVAGGYASHGKRILCAVSKPL